TVEPGGQNVSGSFLRKVKSEDLQLSVELALRGAELLLDVEANQADQPLRPGGNTHVAFGTRSLQFYRAKVETATAEQKREIQPLLENLTGANRRLVEVKLERTRREVKDRVSFREYTNHANGWLTQYGMPGDGKSVDPLPILVPWMETAKRYDSAESFGSYSLLKQLTWQFKYKPKLPPSSYEQYRKLWEVMEQHQFPHFRLTGKLGRIAMDLEHNLSGKERQDRILEFRLLVQKEIETDAAKKSVGLRINLYYVAFHAVELLVNLPGYNEEIAGLCDFMLKRKEVINSIAQSAVFIFMARRTLPEGRRALE